MLSGSLLSPDFLARSRSVLGHLNILSKHLKHLSLAHKLLIAPLSIHNYKFYQGGVVFQLLYDTKKREVFLTGGRYDHLIKEQRPKALVSSENCYAVGFNLGWEKLWKSMMNHQKMALRKNVKKIEDGALHGRWAEPRVSQVLVFHAFTNFSQVRYSRCLFRRQKSEINRSGHSSGAMGGRYER